MVSSGWLEAADSIQTNLVPFATQWRYNANGINLGTAWREPGYDDSSWSQGDSILGAPSTEYLPPGLSTGINTPLPLTDAVGQPIITYYFRTTFTLDYPTNRLDLTIGAVVDDGAVFYLNGQEVQRLGMPGTPSVIGYSTSANRTAEVQSTGRETFAVSPNTLVPGLNVLAVEVHQAGATSSDVIFGADLTATVLPPGPRIFVHPTDVIAHAGGNVQFTVSAQGESPLSYQWRRNGIDLPAATDATLSLTGVTADQVGYYSAVVSDAAGATASSNATLSVTSPELTSALDFANRTWLCGGHANWFPESDTTYDGEQAAQSGPLEADQEAWIQTTVFGPGIISFRWKVSSDEDTLKFLVAGEETAAVSGDVDWQLYQRYLPGGIFQLRWIYERHSSDAGVVHAGWLDQVVLLPPPTAPWIVTQPESQTVLEDTSPTLSVAAVGAAVLRYQWLRDGTALPGATNADLVLPQISRTEAGDYTVIVSNGSGSATSSPPAHLTVWRSYMVSTFAPSTAQRGDAKDGAGLEARLHSPEGAAVDLEGNIYIADTSNHTIRKVTPEGETSTLAGLAGQSGSADGVGSEARFNLPRGVAVDRMGTVFVADTGNHTIRKISPDGCVTTWVGTAGTHGTNDGVGADALFYGPSGVAVDRAGNVYVTDTANYLIRKITPAAEVKTLAGAPGGPFGSNVDGVGSEARFDGSYGIAVDSQGWLYVADYWNSTIRKISPVGEVITFAGAPRSTGTADGQGGQARLYHPCGVAVDGADNLYIADTGNHSVRKITPNGYVTTLAGLSGSAGGVDGAAADARFSAPRGIAVDRFGQIYVDDTGNHALRKVTSEHGVTTLVGPGNAIPGVGFNFLYGIAAGPDGWLYTADLGGQVIEKVSPDGDVSVLAGELNVSGTNDGMGTAAHFYEPRGVAVDGEGNVYVADCLNNTIRKIDPAGQVTTIAGTPDEAGTADGLGSAARFDSPRGIAVDHDGNVFVSDTYNSTIRKITPAGEVTTLAGVPRVLGSADGIGQSAWFAYPRSLTVDAAGYLYVSDLGNGTIRKVSPLGEVTTVAGQATEFGDVDGVGSAARFRLLKGIAVAPDGTLFVADRFNHTIRKVSPTGEVITIAGHHGVAGYADGVGATAYFDLPEGVTLDAAGNVYVTDVYNNVVRKLSLSCPDRPVVDAPSGPVGAQRQLDTNPQTATAWKWSVVRRPGDSSVTLSDESVSNPVFTPDVPGLYIFSLQATNSVAGETALRMLEFTATVSAAPFIARSPGSQKAFVGDDVAFSVVASGESPLSYQWLLDGVPLTEATNATLLLRQVTLGDAGVYRVEVSNGMGSQTSSSATLTVREVLRFSSTAFGIENGEFHLQLEGLSGYDALVLESSTNLIYWEPVLTNGVAGQPLIFNEPLSDHPRRFYRLVEP